MARKSCSAGTLKFASAASDERTRVGTLKHVACDEFTDGCVPYRAVSSSTSCFQGELLEKLCKNQRWLNDALSTLVTECDAISQRLDTLEDASGRIDLIEQGQHSMSRSLQGIQSKFEANCTSVASRMHRLTRTIQGVVREARKSAIAHAESMDQVEASQIVEKHDGIDLTLCSASVSIPCCDDRICDLETAFAKLSSELKAENKEIWDALESHRYSDAGNLTKVSPQNVAVPVPVNGTNCVRPESRRTPKLYSFGANAIVVPQQYTAGAETDRTLPTSPLSLISQMSPQRGCFAIPKSGSQTNIIPLVRCHHTSSRGSLSQGGASTCVGPPTNASEGPQHTTRLPGALANDSITGPGASLTAQTLRCNTSTVAGSPNGLQAASAPQKGLQPPAGLSVNPQCIEPPVLKQLVVQDLFRKQAEFPSKPTLLEDISSPGSWAKPQAPKELSG